MDDKNRKNNDDLIDSVSRRTNYLGLNSFDDRVLEVMRKTDRALFAPGETKHVYDDSPVSIGNGQTCSQPSMVAAMATFLSLREGMKVLEVGTGSGYSAIVTAGLINPGILFTIEYEEKLAGVARENILKTGRGENIRFHHGDGSAGLPEEAPFDRIYFTAGAGTFFNEEPLLKQLSEDGILLYPESQGAMHLVRKTRRDFIRKFFDGVSFVTLKGKNSGFRQDTAN